MGRVGLQPLMTLYLKRFAGTLCLLDSLSTGNEAQKSQRMNTRSNSRREKTRALEEDLPASYTTRDHRCNSS